MDRKEILKQIRLAKDGYILNEVQKGKPLLGMCWYLSKYLGIGYKEIKSVIPEFNHEFLGSKELEDEIYWWPVKDTSSRISAFDKLIMAYEKDDNVCETDE